MGEVQKEAEGVNVWRLGNLAGLSVYPVLQGYLTVVWETGRVLVEFLRRLRG